MYKLKRIAVIVLALALLFLASCSGSAVAGTPAEKIVGKWCYTPNEDILDIVTQVINDPGVYVKLYYEFYEDGTGVTYLSTDDSKMEFTYSFDGETLTINGGDGSFDTRVKLSGNVLSVYDEAVDKYLDMKRQ